MVANVEVKVVAERVQYFDANGKLITESLKDYTRKTLAKEFTHWMIFSDAGAAPRRNRRSLMSLPTKGSSLKPWPTRSAGIAIPSTWSVMSPGTAAADS